MAYDSWVPCNHPSCNKKFPNNKFTRIKAGDAGWFFQKDDVAWCPEHVPDWVGPWRARKKAEAEMFQTSIAVAGGSVTVRVSNGNASCSYEGELPRDIALELIRRSEAAHPSGITVNDKSVTEYAEELLS